MSAPVAALGEPAQQSEAKARSGSESSELSWSTTDSETDTDVADWKQVPFSFLLTDNLILALRAQKKLTLPKELPPLSPRAPSKLSLWGHFKFVEYIPPWTHPDWKDDSIKGKDGVAEKRLDTDYGVRRRPALLPKDDLKNPSPYARRWGIYPGRNDGRSRLSPTGSTTRRIGLPEPLGTEDNQLKYFLTGEDLARELETEASKFGVPVMEYLAALRSTPMPAEDGSALGELYSMTEDDKDLQRITFYDMTTDEKVAYGIHTVEELDFVQFDIAGPLHSLVSRQRWMSTVDRGSTKTEPRYLYNLFGRRGEYSADDELIWMALQPALQIVTHVLNTNHPFWITVMDVFQREKISHRRNPFGSSGPKLVSVWEYLKKPAMPAEGQTLQDAGFDLSRAAAEYMMERVEITIGSAYRTTGSGAVDQIWGATTMMNDTDAAMRTILIEICAESIWPLLVPTFTQAEKAAISFTVASTLLHELAHATHMAIRCLVVDPLNEYRDVAQLEDLDMQVLAALDNVGRELLGDVTAEPYWEDEPRDELGYAFENQLWGGVIVNLTERTNRSFEFINLEVGLETWPGARADPHSLGGRVLVKPPLPVDSMVTPLPVQSWSKLFTKHFWEHNYRKYGHRALKLVPDKPVPTVLNRHYKRLRDFKRIFGKGEGHWLYYALTKLQLVGRGTIHTYLRELVNDRIEHIWVRKRWHHDCRLWSYRNKKLSKLFDAAEDWSRELAKHFKLINESVMDKTKSVMDYNNRVMGAMIAGVAGVGQMLDMATYTNMLLQQLDADFNKLIAAYEAVHQHLLVELQHIQSLVVDYVQQKPEDRQTLYDRYGIYFYEQIRDTFEDTLGDALGHLDRLAQLFSNAGSLTPQIEADIKRVRTSLQIDKNHFAQTKVYLQRDYIQRVDEGWRGRFATVPSGRYHRRTKAMEKLAIQEMTQCEEPVQKVIEMFGRILNKHTDLFNTVNKNQEDALTASLQKTLQASRERRVKAAGSPVWAALNEALGVPKDNGMRFAKPVYPNLTDPVAMNVDTPPWTPAVTAATTRTSTPQHPFARTVAFGVPNKPVPSPPGTPPSGAASKTFTQYAGASSPFPVQWPGGTSVFATNPSTALPPPPTSAPRVGLGGAPVPPGWKPFGDPYSVTATISEDLHGAALDIPHVDRLFGAEAFMRERARNMEAGRGAGSSGGAAGTGSGSGTGGGSAGPATGGGFNRAFPSGTGDF